MRHLVIMVLGLGMLLQTASSPSLAMPARRYRVALLTPRNDAFWTLFATIAQAAAKDLNLDLEWFPALNQPHKQLADAKRLLARTHQRPDALIFKNYEGTAGPILELAEKAGVYSLMFEESFNAQEQQKYGRPREKYKYWLGEFLPDNVEAGYDALLGLARQARAKGWKGPLPVLALAGNPSEGSSLERLRGLQAALQAEPELLLLDIISAYWRRDLAQQKVQRALEREPGIRLIWSANDTMPMGARQALKTWQSNHVNTPDILISGIGSTPEAALDVSKGQVDLSVGGQFLLAGFTLVLLHDYLHGRDFAVESTLMRLRLYPFDQRNILRYTRAMSRPKPWEQIDFRQFSKIHHRELQTYRFGFEAVLAQLDRAPAR
ncbi:MAG: ABC transporter substrate-binding protein [Candidatus Sericytochromatia bacterium]